jgi:Family of unknown function (DUF6941)
VEGGDDREGMEMKSASSDETSKPVLVAAALCEKVLTEADGALSIIRMVDKFTIVTPPNVPPDAKPHVSMSLVVALRWPNVKAQGEVTVRVVGPSNKAHKVNDKKAPVEFPGGYTSGVNLILNMLVVVEGFGDCRIEVEWNGEYLAAVPFTLDQGSTLQDVADARSGSPPVS